MTPDLAATVKRLKELAGKATPREWRFDPHEPGGQWAGNITAYLPRYAGEVQQIITISCQRKASNALENAAYIAAANPRAVAEVLAELERVTGERDAAVADVTRLKAAGNERMSAEFDREEFSG